MSNHERTFHNIAVDIAKMAMEQKRDPCDVLTALGYLACHMIELMPNKRLVVERFVTAIYDGTTDSQEARH